MNDHYPFTNPPLPYAYNALEPFIDEKTMELHHDRHLQTYIDNLNKALQDYPEYHNVSLGQLITHTDELPEEIRASVKNNAGGVYNHIFFFSNMNPPSEQPIPTPLSEYINNNFGSFENFRESFTRAALSVFGSGYAWLVLTPDGRLEILTTANQDTPFEQNLCPLVNLDVWEHAYYLKHYNVRADYIKNWFDVAFWEQVNQNLMYCLAYSW